LIEENPQMQLRPMTSLDLPRVLAIEAASYPDPWNRKTFEDCLAAQAKGCRCYVLLAEESVVGHGVLTVVVDEAELLNFCLAPEHRSQGKAAVYFDRLLALLQEQGAKNLFLEVRQSNTPARRLYAGAGMREVGVRKDYYPSKEERENAVLMGLEF
jgi:ribosomal-protein-alanine N-acetyltransferase